jgi:glycosyltransferase involved in cell wall biosynthesis
MNFFEFETPTGIYKLPTRKDVLYVPWLYSPNYCLEQNRLFSDVFTCYSYKEEVQQRKKQIEAYKYNIECMNNIRVSKKMFKAIYFNNIIDDFDIHFYTAGGIDKIYGFQHDSNRQKYLLEKGIDREVLIKQENFVGSIANKIFVGSKFMQNILPYTTEVIGLPIFVSVKEPRNDDRILFNHRFAKEKNWHKLFELSSEMKKKLIHPLCKLIVVGE